MVRRLLPDDHVLYQGVRLRALATDPEVFSSNLSRESALPEKHWRLRLQDEKVGIFGVFDGDEIVGMTGIAIDNDDPMCAFLWGSWLEPEVRGRGLSREMYRARIDWARVKGLARVVVSHRRSNLPSMRANQQFGFRTTHRVQRSWPDGTVEDELHYQLDL